MRPAALTREGRTTTSFHCSLLLIIARSSRVIDCSYLSCMPADRDQKALLSQLLSVVETEDVNSVEARPENKAPEICHRQSKTKCPGDLTTWMKAQSNLII